MNLNDEIGWVNSILIKAKVEDPTKDFCDGTVFMELIVLLVLDNDTAVSEALEKFHEDPPTMAHSLRNLRAVLKCLAEDKTSVDVKPLDLYRGKQGAILQLLTALRVKYYGDMNTSNTKISLQNSPPEMELNAKIDDRNSTTYTGLKNKEVVTSSSALSEGQLTVLKTNESIIIILKKGDPLCVDRHRLTKNSIVFKRQIEELSFYEIEMDDFEPDTVGIFLTLLEEEKANDFEEAQFRELHKMAVVYEVSWLQENCRSWLCGKIKKDMGPGEKFYVFEECLFILRKWNLNDLMDLLISTIITTDNTQFIMDYLKDLKKVDQIQIDLMLKIRGCEVEGTKMFLQIVQLNLVDETELDENIKYLIEKLDLTQCFEELNELYFEVLDAIRNLRDITVKDLRFVLEISTKIMKQFKMYQPKKESNETKPKDGSFARNRCFGKNEDARYDELREELYENEERESALYDELQEELYENEERQSALCDELREELYENEERQSALCDELWQEQFEW